MVPIVIQLWNRHILIENALHSFARTQMNCKSTLRNYFYNDMDPLHPISPKAISVQIKNIRTNQWSLCIAIVCVRYLIGKDLFLSIYVRITVYLDYPCPN